MNLMKPIHIFLNKAEWIIKKYNEICDKISYASSEEFDNNPEYNKKNLKS